MIYCLRGGYYLQACTDIDLVKKLNERSLFGSKIDLHEYMNTVARECMNEYKITIRTDSYEHFIDDLIANGFILEMSEEPECPGRSRNGHPPPYSINDGDGYAI